MRGNLNNEMEIEEEKMFILIGVLFVLIGIILIWFHVPYSPVKEIFRMTLALLCLKISYIQIMKFYGRRFQQFTCCYSKYIQGCGYIGTPKMSYLKMEYNNVDFSQGKTVLL